MDLENRILTSKWVFGPQNGCFGVDLSILGEKPNRAAKGREKRAHRAEGEGLKGGESSALWREEEGIFGGGV